MNVQEKFKALEDYYTYIEVRGDESNIEQATKKSYMDLDCEKALASGDFYLIQADCYVDAEQRNRRFRYKV